MNEAQPQSPFSGKGPAEQSTEQSTGGKNNKSENASEASAPPGVLDETKPPLNSDPVGPEVEEATNEGKAAADEPPVDWFEPLEDDDDAHSWDMPSRRDPEEESLAGESEMSGSVASCEKTFKRKFDVRRRNRYDEGWIDWPVLGKGWKRREVIRRSGSSIGQRDVYYLGPGGKRARSRVELFTLLEGIMDLTSFDFKTGVFHDGYKTPIRKRRRKIRDRSSSESSWMEREEGADTPDSNHKPGHSLDGVGIPIKGPQEEGPPREHKVKLKPPASVNGHAGLKDSLLCAVCGALFAGTWYEKQRKRPCCPRCRNFKRKGHQFVHLKKDPESASTDQQKPDDGPETSEQSHPQPNNSDTEDLSVNMDDDDQEDVSTDDDDLWHKRRKRRSCGTCKSCLCRKDCGTCDFCVDKPKFGGRNKKRQKCRLRQCQRQAMLGRAEIGTREGMAKLGRPKPHYTYSRKKSFKRRKGAPDDLSDEEEDYVHPEALNQVGSRQRNGFPDRVPNIRNHTISQMLSTSHMTSSLSAQGPLGRWDVERANIAVDVAKHAWAAPVDDLPMITQIFSLAESPPRRKVDVDSQLFKLMEALRASKLPVLWFAILKEGPQLQLVQCAKRSNMADTAVLIDGGFCYQVTFQKQPLLPTHPLYKEHPTHLSSVSDVVNLLSDLEHYGLCHGLPSPQPPASKGLIIMERASTCDFLVEMNAEVCANCRALCGLYED